MHPMVWTAEAGRNGAGENPRRGSVSNQVWVTQPRMATCRVVAPKRRLNLWRSAIVVARGKGYRYLIRPWLPSQKGASPVCLHMHHATVSAVATVTFFGAKPVP